MYSKWTGEVGKSTLSAPTRQGTVIFSPSLGKDRALVEIKVTGFLSIHVTGNFLRKTCIIYSKVPWGNLELVFLPFSVVGNPIRLVLIVPVARVSFPIKSTTKLIEVKKLSMTTTCPRPWSGPTIFLTTFSPWCASPFLRFVTLVSDLHAP